jgi:cell division transport system ATP-binding protein
VNLRLEKGGFLFLAGSSGAGKSTVLKILYGAERVSSGEVVVAGRNLTIAGADERALLRRDIGIIFQDYKLLPRRTVRENVGLPLEARGVARNDREDAVSAMLCMVRLEDRADAYPETLSGGEQQRVGVARALIVRPKLILADEPTGNLDRETTRQIFELLFEAHAAGVTVIIATHNLSMIEESNMRTVVLDRGKIIGDFEKPRGAKLKAA